MLKEPAYHLLFVSQTVHVVVDRIGREGTSRRLFGWRSSGNIVNKTCQTNREPAEHLNLPELVSTISVRNLNKRIQRLGAMQIRRNEREA